jgi:hypothetical protein
MLAPFEWIGPRSMVEQIMFFSGGFLVATFLALILTDISSDMSCAPAPPPSGIDLHERPRAVPRVCVKGGEE